MTNDDIKMWKRYLKRIRDNLNDCRVTLRRGVLIFYCSLYCTEFGWKILQKKKQNMTAIIYIVVVTAKFQQINLN